MLAYLTRVHSGRMAPLERALCAALAMLLIFILVALTEDANPAAPRDSVTALDIGLAVVSTAISGFASGLSTLARFAIGLFVIVPLDQTTGILTGRPDALKASRLVPQVVATIAYTVLLPYLDLPQRVHAWSTPNGAKSSRLRALGVYGLYSLWTTIVLVALFGAAWVLWWLAGILIMGKDGAEIIHLDDRIGYGVAVVWGLTCVALVYLWRQQGWVTILKRFVKSAALSLGLLMAIGSMVMVHTILGAKLRSAGKSISGLAPLTEMIDEYVKDPTTFLFDLGTSYLLIAVLLVPVIALLWQLWDAARAKGRQSYVVSAVILLALMVLSLPIVSTFVDYATLLVAGPEAVQSTVWIGRVLGAGIGLALAWWIVVRSWPRKRETIEFPEKERMPSILPADVAQAVQRAQNQ